MKKLLLLTLLSFGAIGVFSQENMEGVITDEKGEAIPYANVILKQDDKIIDGAATDFEGYYFFNNLKAGTYELTISNSSKTTEPTIIIIKENEPLAYNMSMNTSNNIKKAVITGSKSLFNSYEVNVDIKSHEIFLETRIKDISEMEKIGTGVTENSKGEISYRGSRPGSGVYVVDGMPVYGKLNIPTSSIYSMKVYNGGVPAKFGNTTSAIVEIRTKSFYDFFN